MAGTSDVGGRQPSGRARAAATPRPAHASAQLRLDYGEWLRRQRRINNAKPVLAAALETFRQLGASPWIRRAEAELRACSISDAAAPAAHHALTRLTAQQREIVILAGRG